MKKRICVLAIVIMGLLLFGCNNTQSITNNKNKENNKKNVVSNYYYPGKNNDKEVVFNCGNYGLKIYDAYSSYRSLKINVYSFKELSLENVDVKIDVETPYKVYMDKNKYTNEEHDQMIRESIKACNKKLKEEDIKKLDIQNIPRINSYILNVNFDMSKGDYKKEEEHFSSIKVNIDGKEYNVNVGNVELIYKENESLKDIDEGNAVFGQTGGADGFPISPDSIANQKFEYSGFMFNTKKNIDITEISMLDDEQLKIKDVRLEISGDMSMNVEYKKNKIVKIKKGSSVSMIINFKDNRLKKPLNYNTSAILYFRYKCNGKEYTVINTPSFRTLYYPYEVYAQSAEGKDVVNYYKEKVNN